MTIEQCKKHVRLILMLESRIFDGTINGWWCVFCGTFLENKNLPHLELLQALVKQRMNNEFESEQYTGN